MKPTDRIDEPLGRTLLRNSVIAVSVGMIVAASMGRFGRWPPIAITALWPSLGGHYVELWFLNWLRPRLPESRVIRMAARVAVWFVGGVLLFMVMHQTWLLLTRFRPRWPGWWVGGLAFIGIELVANSVLWLRRRQA